MAKADRRQAVRPTLRALATRQRLRDVVALPPGDPAGEVAIATCPDARSVRGAMRNCGRKSCPVCRVAFSMSWAGRALIEYATAKQAGCRTWFGTLTYADSVTALRASYAPLQAAWKRLRAKGHAFRFVAFHERGSLSGRPHWHVLLHEAAAPIGRRIIEAEWSEGFTNFRLMRDERVAGYVAKYATKDPQQRVRASARYGRPSAAQDEALEKLRQQIPSDWLAYWRADLDEPPLDYVTRGEPVPPPKKAQQAKADRPERSEGGVKHPQGEP